jgi:hypothetical protein
MLITRSRSVSLPKAPVLMAMLMAAVVALTQASAAVQQPAEPGTVRGQAMGSGMGRMPVNEAQVAAMMAERQKMMADMKAMDKKLEELVARMKAVSGTGKMAAIEAVVTELAAERGRMGRMMTLQDGMMMSCPMLQAPEKESTNR